MEVAAVNFNNTAKKSKIKMLFLLAGSVLFCSFIYGFSVGLKRPAYANLRLNNGPVTAAADTFQDLPQGIKIVPIGQNVSIKGRKASVANFLTNRNVESVLNEQREIWEKQGIRTLGAVSSSRGTLLGEDLANQQRKIMIIWAVPPSLRRVSANNYHFQGIVSQISTEKSPNLGVDEFARSLGVPLKNNSDGGVVFSAIDNGVESRTASVINPGNISENVNFYEASLKQNGWALQSKERLGEGKNALIKLDFSRQEQLYRY